MKNYSIKSAVLFTALLLFVTGIFAQVDNVDTGLWNDVQLTKPINKHLDVVGGIRFDTKKDTSRFAEQRLYFGVNLKRGNFAVQPTLVVLRNFARVPYFEYRPQVLVSYKIKADKTITITPKVRAEYHFKQGIKNDWRVVPIITIEKKLNKKYSLFNTDEFWVSNNGNDVAQFRKRLFFGVTRSVNKSLAIDFFYLYQRDEQVSPKNHHKLGLTWKVRL